MDGSHAKRVTIDTTVQTKAVAHPTDSHLLHTGVRWLARLARRHGVALRQSFVRLAAQARREAARLMHGPGHRQALRHVRRLRTFLGRLHRDVGRKLAGRPDLEATFATAQGRAARLLAPDAPVPDDAAGLLPAVLTDLMRDIGIPNGIGGVGYTEDDVPDLVPGTMKQQRLLATCPRTPTEDDIAGILTRSIENW